jgi:hypothetical protein
MDAILNHYDTVYGVYLGILSGGGDVYEAVAGQKYGRPPKHEEGTAKRHIPASPASPSAPP